MAAAWQLFPRRPKRRIGLGNRKPKGISRCGGDLTSTAEAIVPYQAVSSGYPMVSVNFKLAILTVLANWPDRRATIDEIKQEVGIIFANGDQTDLLKRLSALGDIDIFQTGLVSRNEEGFQITDAGLSLLQSLENFDGPPSPDLSTAPASQPFRLIDDLVGTEERLKIFDLELRT